MARPFFRALRGRDQRLPPAMRAAWRARTGAPGGARPARGLRWTALGRGPVEGAVWRAHGRRRGRPQSGARRRARAARAPAVTGPLPSINSILWSGFARSVFRCRPILEARVVGNGRNGRNGRCNGPHCCSNLFVVTCSNTITAKYRPLPNRYYSTGWSRRCAQSIQRRWFALGQLKSIYPGLLWHLL